MIKGKKALFSMIVTAAFMASSITTPADAIKKDTVLESKKITTMEVFGTSNLNIRTGSSTKYKRIGYAKKGQTVEVISISKGWAKISYKGSTAYVSAKYLKNVSSQKVNEEMVVKVNTLNVRSGSSTKHKILGKLKKNDKVKVISTSSNGWVKIEYKGGYAYISNAKGSYLGKVSQSNSSTSTTFKKIEMIANVKSLNVRTGPSTKYSTMGKLSKGDIVIAVDKLSNGWMKVEYKGKIGYISNSKGTYLKEGALVENREKANNVIDLINNLQKNITLNHKSAVNKARVAYNSLNSKSKALVTNLNKLVNAENKIEELEKELEESNKNKELANKVINAINSLSDNVSLSEKSKVVNTRKMYSELPQEAKDLVTNLNKLVNAENKIEELEKELEESNANKELANKVINAINSLSDNISLSEKSKVVDTRKMYSELPQEAKALVTNLNKLVTAENKIKELETYSVNAKKMEDKISTLDREILYKDYSLIKEVRTEFNALSKEEQKLVSNVNILINAESQMNKILDRVHNVIDLINKIPEKITLEDKAMIENIRTAYEALKDDEKETLKGVTLSMLINAETEINRLETIENNESVKNVVSLIESLPNVEEITYDKKEEVMSALNSYRALPEELKFAVDITKLMDAVDRIEIMDAKIVVAEINDLPSVENINKNDKEKIESIRDKYDAISIRNNLRVTNLNVLIAAEKELERSINAVNAIESLIKSIPETSKITLSDKTLIEKVRAEYEALLLKDKNAVDSQYYKVLVEAEDTIKNLEKSSQVKSVNDKINSLMDKELTLDDKSLVQEIRMLYDNLHISLKEAVNVSMIEEFEMKIDELEVYSENAKQMEDKIATLDREIFYKDYSLIKEIRNEFNALSKEEQKLVSNTDILIDAENQMKQILDRVHNVIDLINNIPEKITLEDKAMIENTRTAYEALKDDEKETLNGITLSMLISAEIEINRLETIENNENVKNIVSLIESLPNAEEITYDDKEEVMSVLKAYRELPEDVKFSVDITKLMDAVDKIEIMDAKIIVEEINSLPSVENITIDDKGKIESIRAKYDAISIRNNRRVTNLNILIAAEEKLKTLEGNVNNL